MRRSKDAVPLLDRRGLIKPYRDREIEPDISPEDSILGQIMVITMLLLFLVMMLLGMMKVFIIEFPLREEHLVNGGWLCISLLFALYIYDFAYPKILKAFWHRNLEINDLSIMVDNNYPGGRSSCHLQFQAKRMIYLKRVTATLSAVEVARKGEDESADTRKKAVFEYSHTKSCDENLSPGRRINFTWHLPVIPEELAGLNANQKKLKWTVKVRISFKGLLCWEKRIPVTVIP